MNSFFNEHVSSSCSRLNFMRDLMENGNTRFTSCTKIISYMETERDLLKEQDYRISFNFNKVKILYAIAKIAYSSCKCDQVVNPNNIIEHVLRCLRNACVRSPKNQYLIASHKKLFGLLIDNFRIMFTLALNEEQLIGVRLALQFLGNLCAGTDSPKKQVFDELKTNLNLILLLKHPDLKVRQYSSMLFFNCLCEEIRTEILLDKEKCQSILEMVLKVFKDDDVEWSLFTIEYFIEDPSFWVVVYPNLDKTNKHVVLDILLEKITNDKGYNHLVSKEPILFIISNLKSMVQYILNSPSSYPPGDPLETLKHIEILCYASLNSALCETVKSDSYLLELILILLKTIHTLGKQGMPEFEPIENLTSLIEPPEEIVNSPFFSLKCYLIRLISNMCDESLTNQNIVREATGIELILDCCNLDAKNPFIIQWCIVAVRNLMKNNNSNQQRLANLSSLGPYKKSPVLTQLGIVVENEENKNLDS